MANIARNYISNYQSIQYNQYTYGYICYPHDYGKPRCHSPIPGVT